MESIRHPLAGPRGEELFTDVVRIGPERADSVLVLSSGIPGVEGFAGSGIQTGLMREQIEHYLPQGMAILMIHAVNPYGMAHLRRFNEDNIDLNRNFRDHSTAYPVNEGYQALADYIAIGKYEKLHSVLVSKNTAAIGTVKFGKVFFALGVNIKIVKRNTMLNHILFGNLAPGASSDRIDSIAHE